MNTNLQNRRGLLPWFRKRTPPQLLVLSFLFVILLGTIVLKLPFAHKGKLSLTDALFTATSATCVTGLIVKDTGKDFTRAGQIIILILIQIGGLGLMTISSAFILFLGKNIGRTQWQIMRDVFTGNGNIHVITLIRWVVVLTCIFESLGTLLLLWRWGKITPRMIVYGMNKEDTLFYALFHAISAFNNAGFSLFTKNFETLHDDAYTILTIAGLIIFGGLGYFVIFELFVKMLKEREHWRRLPSVLSLHTRLVLLVTLVLIVVGTGLFLVLESGNTLRSLPFTERLLAAFFQAVTPRTAGFNSLDIGQLTTSTLLLLMLLMMIGASPGSTGGGIKTSTAGVLYGAVRAEIVGEKEILMFHRMIPKETVRRAIAVVAMAITLVASATMLIIFIEAFYTPFYQAQSLFIQVTFETVSAFGTVGLSTGLTPTLHGMSKIVLCIVMLLGRVGPLTVALTFSETKQRILTVELPEESPMIG